MCYKSSLNAGTDQKCAIIGNIDKDKNNIQTENKNFMKVCWSVHCKQGGEDRLLCLSVKVEIMSTPSHTGLYKNLLVYFQSDIL